MIAVLIVNLACIALVLLAYPLYCRWQARKPLLPWPEYQNWPSLSVLIVVRNGEDMIVDKLINTLELSYPGPKPEIWVYSDGSKDRTVALAQQFKEVQVIDSHHHHGKIFGLNTLALRAKGEILVFSDTDALLAKDALQSLIRPLADASIGGVCGQRQIQGKGSLNLVQRNYVSWDSIIKQGESKKGSLTSNDGKLYALRHQLFQPIPPAVTDDLYNTLNIVSQGYRFVFAPDAVARVPAPITELAREIPRRRRVVSASLNGLYIQRTLLNPFRFGGYAWQLLINKIARRLLPVNLLLLLLFSALAAPGSSLAFTCLLMQLAGYGFMLLPAGLIPPPLRRWHRRCQYLLFGNIGMLMGWLDMISGQAADKWEPQKDTSHKRSEETEK